MQKTHFMQKSELNGYDKPNFDNRVKSLLAIENICDLVARITGMLVISLVLMLFLSNFVKAQSIPEIFQVPVVRLTPDGAAVFMPQTGEGSAFLPGAQRNTNDTLNSPIVPASKNDIYSGGINYRPPQYDAFAKGSHSIPVNLPVLPESKVDSVDFRILNNMPGSMDSSVGTVKSTFTFSANASSQAFSSYNLQYRWDFENDGKPDSYFSRIQSITHRFPKAGEYTVKLEVLDKNGHVYSGINKVTVVENDEPIAVFQVDKISAPINSIIKFDTSLSSDNQYSRYNLKYRFDWDSDGKFDTTAQNKNDWYHKFSNVGNFTVLMEVTDPEGASALASIDIDISEDNAPDALLSVSRLGQLNYQFDASQSSDDHTPLNSLKFRWDFNYAGPGDIVFDTGWGSSPKYNGNYRIGGSKKIRLQVMDQQGFIGENYAEIDVPWTDGFANLAFGR